MQVIKAYARKTGPRSCLTRTQARRVKRAVSSHKPATAEVQRQGERNEALLAANVPGAGTHGDNDPFDVFIGNKNNPRRLIEVKTIVRGKNDKITMHPESLARKLAFAERHPRATVHTVVFDDRAGKIYHKTGVGSFRLRSMTDLGDDPAVLAGILR